MSDERMMSDDSDEIVLRLRSYVNLAPRRVYRVVIRHTKRTWFRLSRADRNRIRRGEDGRDVWAVPAVKFRRTRAMRDAKTMMQGGE